jgi:hypothetical protein
MGTVALAAAATRTPIIETVAAVLAILLASASLVTDAMIPLVVATAASFYVCGRIFPVGDRNYDFAGVGFWLAVAAAVGHVHRLGRSAIDRALR